VVSIDYLQLISSEEKNENRTQDISKISKSLKLLAKELEITVVSLAQLSRAPEMRADHKPQLSDLRESGAIEQDADIVMFLKTISVYNIQKVNAFHSSLKRWIRKFNGVSTKYLTSYLFWYKWSKIFKR
jgi:replicative DNA helicase